MHKVLHSINDFPYVQEILPKILSYNNTYTYANILYQNFSFERQAITASFYLKHKSENSSVSI